MKEESPRFLEGYVCISSRGPPLPLDLELYSTSLPRYGPNGVADAESDDDMNGRGPVHSVFDPQMAAFAKWLQENLEEKKY